MASSGIAITLGLVNLLVCCLNLLVLYVLISQKSLHTSTNSIVLSLTISDLLLGILVLPFSIFQEYADSWHFGETWCKTWLALDVLLSTASIYNLLAISFDRFMAIRQPLKYRFVSSNRMTKITIVVVWLVSSALAFPPLILDHFSLGDLVLHDNQTEYMGSISVVPARGECTPMTSSNFYILFSALVSFIAPMFLMIGLNICIFHTVSDSRKLTKDGPCTNISGSQRSGVPGNGSVTDDASLWMRVHRGGAKASIHSTKTPDINLNRCASQRSSSMSAAVTLKKMSVIQKDVASVAVTNSIRTKPSLLSTKRITFDSEFCRSLEKGDGAFLPDASIVQFGAQPTANMDQQVSQSAADKSWWQTKNVTTAPPERKQVVVDVDRKSSIATINSTSTPTTSYPYNPIVSKRAVASNIWYPALLTSILTGPTRRSTIFGKKHSERLLVYPMLNQLSRFNLRTELRVARTIGVVVGCFTICWMPFTIIYILQAFETCSVGTCVPPWFFTLAFWLGYANSAINPILYATFSRDFRQAFRRVLIDRNSSIRNY